MAKTVIISLIALITVVPLCRGDCGGFARCQWITWNAWNDCSATCGGGYRTRDRPLCCDVTLDWDACIAACRLNSADALATDLCGGDCHNGAPDTTYPTSCDCTDAYFGSCCENRISCSAPSYVANGDTSGGGSTFYYGDSVTYSCNEGFNLTGGDAVRTCRRLDSWYSSSGSWDGTTPRCAYAISCSSNPCQNGATCVNGLDLYTCICAYGWSGTNCEFDILPPVYDACPDNITRYIASTRATVEWTAPVFADPHGESEVYVTAQNYPQPEASLPWGEYIVQYVALKPINAMQTECTFSVSVYPIPCDPLTAPPGGALACNGWNRRFGEICTLFCESTNDVPIGIRIEDVYVCGATGNWLPTLNEGTSCSEERSEPTADGQTEGRRQHYYEGDCSESEAQQSIRQAYIDILMTHDMSYMCTAQRFSGQCILENVDVICG